MEEKTLTNHHSGIMAKKQQPLENLVSPSSCRNNNQFFPLDIEFAQAIHKRIIRKQ